MRRLLRWILILAVLAGAAWVLRLTILERTARPRSGSTLRSWPDIPTANASPEPAPAPPAPWVAPLAGGASPASHPIKVKLRSKVYRVPGMSGYDQSAADRCYTTPEAAEADGFHRASR